MSIVKHTNSDLLSLLPKPVPNDHVASLRYAQIIQRALMPDPFILKDKLKDFFIFFLPRDIVSGDFYYVYSNKQKICIAAGDCTGHGVPGALMSILGISFLNEIMKSDMNLNANRILNLMREKIMYALHQTGEYQEALDSIDIGLCIIDLSTGRLQFSGANRPLIMIRNGDLTEYKPDKMTLGIAPLKEASFVNTSIDTKPGDSFYLFTDGFADQFGEISDKKFKYKHFKRIIHSFEELPMNQQKEHLENTFNEWKGNSQQIDDVLVIGFQL
ncbi:MAG TPA: SpoIIE family protein phosphatase [Bacteroidales bacterium]|nr:SpoIIE family protein phosphatase [Bacteroidales bacterium]